MQNEFATTLTNMLRATKKSVNQLSELSGVDAAYIRKLLSGEKHRPSPETVVKLWIGLIMDPVLVEADPTFVHGLDALLRACAMTATSFKVMADAA